MKNENTESYELYKLLESNGYETSSENLKTLREGLSTGYFRILEMPDSAFLDEGTSDAYNYCQILEENGYAMTKENIDNIQEAEDDGRVLYEGRLWDAIKERHHQRVVKRHRKKLSRKMKKAWKRGETPLQLAAARKAAERSEQRESGTNNEETPKTTEENENGAR